jgi:uncharacterized protein
MLSGRIPSTQVADFAARGVSMQESFRARESGRLAPLVTADSGYPDQIEATCRFEQGPQGFPELELRISARMGLVCQRCLAPVPWNMETRARLTIVGTEQELGELSDPFDSVLMHDGALDLSAAIEDEILSAIPLAPMHSVGEACGSNRSQADQPGVAKGPANRPFAGLGDLLGRNESDNADRKTDRRGEK